MLRPKRPFVLAGLLLAALVVPFLTGCNAKNDPNPPSGYVKAHEQLWKAEGFIYKKFGEQNPTLKQTADDQREAERRLIEAGKTGIPIPEGGVPATTQPTGMLTPPQNVPLMLPPDGRAVRLELTACPLPDSLTTPARDQRRAYVSSGD